MGVDLQTITKIRERTGAGMMDVKKALDEAQGNEEKAIELLRKRGAAKAVKRAGKVAAEGLVYSYIHGQGRVGVLLEVNCETDFVAKSEPFGALVKDIAMHIAAIAPRYLSRDEVTPEILDKEKRVYIEQLRAEGKPEAMIDKIVEGKMNKFYSEECLLEQSFVKDEDKTIEQLVTAAIGEIGEKITIRRFARYELGEGIEKAETDFAAEVAAQVGE